jgi:hypothetical protein
MATANPSPGAQHGGGRQARAAAAPLPPSVYRAVRAAFPYFARDNPAFMENAGGSQVRRNGRLAAVSYGTGANVNVCPPSPNRNRPGPRVRRRRGA